MNRFLTTVSCFRVFPRKYEPRSACFLPFWIPHQAAIVPYRGSSPPSIPLASDTVVYLIFDEMSVFKSTQSTCRWARTVASRPRTLKAVSDDCGLGESASALWKDPTQVAWREALRRFRLHWIQAHCFSSSHPPPLHALDLLQPRIAQSEGRNILQTVRQSYVCIQGLRGRFILNNGETRRREGSARKDSSKADTEARRWSSVLLMFLIDRYGSAGSFLLVSDRDSPSTTCPALVRCLASESIDPSLVHYFQVLSTQGPPSLRFSVFGPGDHRSAFSPQFQISSTFASCLLIEASFRLAKTLVSWRPMKAGHSSAPGSPYEAGVKRE